MRLLRTPRNGTTGSCDYPRHFDSLGGRFSNFVFCDGQHRTAFDLSYLDEVLRAAGFREVEESEEGRSRLYKESVPLTNRAIRGSFPTPFTSRPSSKLCRFCDTLPRKRGASMRAYINAARFASLIVLLLCGALLRAQQTGLLLAPTQGDYVIPDFHFASGEELHGLRIHYVTFGTPARDAKGKVTNAVLLLHGTSGTGRTIPGATVCRSAIWAGAIA